MPITELLSRNATYFKNETALVEITDKASVTIKALGHKWDKGVVTKEATYTAEGIRTYTCERDSSHTKTEKIPKKQRRSSGGSERTSTTAAGGSWFRDDSGWHYRENGALLKDTWRYIYYNDGYYWYYFDETGTIATGWKQIGGKWYFFEPVEGRNQGRMYSNERTPDGYYVGADGAWDGNPAV